MGLQADLEEKYSIVIGADVPADMREELESELMSDLMREIPANVGIEPEYIGDVVHGWAISDGGSIDGILWTCLWPDGMLNSTLTFLKFEKEGENANQTPT